MGVQARTPLVMTERKTHPPDPVGGAKLSGVEWGHGVSNKVLLVLWFWFLNLRLVNKLTCPLPSSVNNGDSLWLMCPVMTAMYNCWGSMVTQTLRRRFYKTPPYVLAKNTWFPIDFPFYQRIVVSSTVLRPILGRHAEVMGWVWMGVLTARNQACYILQSFNYKKW